MLLQVTSLPFIEGAPGLLTQAWELGKGQWSLISEYLLNTYYLPDTVLGTLRAFCLPFFLHFFSILHKSSRTPWVLPSHFSPGSPMIDQLMPKSCGIRTFTLASGTLMLLLILCHPICHHPICHQILHFSSASPAERE